MGPATYWSPARTCRDSPSVVAPTVARHFLENKSRCSSDGGTCPSGPKIVQSHAEMGGATQRGSPRRCK